VKASPKAEATVGARHVPKPPGGAPDSALSLVVPVHFDIK
jgi:hypothetical protein